MKKFLISVLLAAASVSAAAQAPAGSITVSASSLRDAAGHLINDATVSFAPVNTTGAPISFRHGTGGQAVMTPAPTGVSNGAFSIIVSDTAQTAPANVCYRVTVADNETGENLLGPGYECVQAASTASSWCTYASSPTGAGNTCNFDIYTPNLGSLAIIQTGPSGTLAVHSVTTGSPGSSAAVSNSGTAQNAQLDFTLPQGPTGNTGATGPAATVAVGTVTTTSPGGSATVSNGGTAGAAVLNFQLPQGTQGPSGTLAIGTVTQGSTGSTASVTNSGTAQNAVFNIVIPTAPAGTDSNSVHTNTFLAQAVQGPLQALSLGGSYYASQYTGGTSTTRVASIFADTSVCPTATGCTVISDQSYTGETGYGLSTLPTPPNSLFLSRLHNKEARFYHDWPNESIYGLVRAPAEAVGCLDNLSSTTAQSHSSVSHFCAEIDDVSNVPGYSMGNPTNVQDPGWYVPIGLSVNTTVRGMGIAESLGSNLTKYGTGDNAGFYTYTYGRGGFISASDEGTKAFGAGTQELQTPFTAILATGVGLGSTQLTTTSSNGQQGVGQMLIDIGQGANLNVAPYSGNVVSIGAGLAGGINAVTTDMTVPVSNAWGVLSANVKPTRSMDAPLYSVSASFTVTVTSGTFDTTHLLCFGSEYHECTVPTSVSVNAGVATIVAPLRRPHSSGGLVMQGGLAGNALEFVKWSGQQNQTSLRYPMDIIGSSGANTIQATSWFAGNSTGVFVPAFTYQADNISTVSSSGTTVTATYVVAGSTLPVVSNTTPILISGLSDSSLNTTCTNLTWVTPTIFHCTIAGLSGTHTSTTTGTFNLGLTAIKVWPWAETLDVLNHTTNPESVDGTLTLEPNVINFVALDRKRGFLAALFGTC